MSFVEESIGGGDLPGSTPGIAPLHEGESGNTSAVFR